MKYGHMGYKKQNFEPEKIIWEIWTENLIFAKNEF